jgi:hypothetical protein
VAPATLPATCSVSFLVLIRTGVWVRRVIGLGVWGRGVRQEGSISRLVTVVRFCWDSCITAWEAGHLSTNACPHWWWAPRGFKAAQPQPASLWNGAAPEVSEKGRALPRTMTHMVCLGDRLLLCTGVRGGLWEGDSG